MHRSRRTDSPGDSLRPSANGSDLAECRHPAHATEPLDPSKELLTGESLQPQHGVASLRSPRRSTGPDQDPKRSGSAMARVRRGSRRCRRATGCALRSSARSLRTRPLPDGRNSETGRRPRCSPGARIIWAPKTHPAWRSTMTQSSGTTNRRHAARVAMVSGTCVAEVDVLDGPADQTDAEQPIQRPPGDSGRGRLTAGERLVTGQRERLMRSFAADSISSKSMRRCSPGPGADATVVRAPVENAGKMRRLAPPARARCADSADQRADAAPRSRNQIVSSRPVTPAAGISCTSAPPRALRDRGRLAGAADQEPHRRGPG